MRLALMERNGRNDAAGESLGRWVAPALASVCGLAIMLPTAAMAQHHRASSTKSKASAHATAHESARVRKAPATGKAAKGAKSAKAGRAPRGRITGVPRAEHETVQVPTAESRRLSTAFVASAQLRPMAQQLILTRSPAAYSGVASYAASHPGDAAATAQLALGHAYAQDRRFADAIAAFRQAAGANRDGVLADYADFLAAQAAFNGGQPGEAIALLNGFADRYPGSVFQANAPVLLGQAYLAGGDTGSAIRVLETAQNTGGGAHLDVRMTLAKAYQQAGRTADASRLYRGVYLGEPLTNEARTSLTQLAALNVPLTAAERKQHADALFNAKQYAAAAGEYRDLERNGAGLTQADRDALEIYGAVCDLKLKRLSRRDIAQLPNTGDDTAALKMYMQSELARSEGNTGEHDDLVAQLTANYPQSRWLEEALFSGAQMYLLKRDTLKAIAAYQQLVERFPRSTYAPNAHWRAAWLNYRLRRFPEAARLFDEQIRNYPAGTEIPGALYWRARLYEDVESNFGQAANYYQALSGAYCNSYYAILGRTRLGVIGSRAAAVDPAPTLASVRPLNDPHLTDQLPENDPHLIKARLLANAALNEYIRPEINQSATSVSWGALAEAEIYQSFGENARALQAMKRSHVPFFSLPVSEVPAVYWNLVFPRPYWSSLAADAQTNGLDPFLVASLIRQESEFNPGAVSRANAYGLMQIVPSTGKMLSKQLGQKGFATNSLLDPAENLQLGTRYLKQRIDNYGGQVEYALAAYNAGDGPVRQWLAANDYRDVPEFVESIPYTETREYVQSILRNREVYRAVYAGR